MRESIGSKKYADMGERVYGKSLKHEDLILFLFGGSVIPPFFIHIIQK